MVKQTDPQIWQQNIIGDKGQPFIYFFTHSLYIHLSTQQYSLASFRLQLHAILEAGKNTSLIQSNQTLCFSSSQYDAIVSRKLTRKTRVQDMKAVSEMSEDSKKNQTIIQGSRELEN